MKKVLLLFCLLFFVNLTVNAQEAGNRIYGNRGYYNQANQPRRPFMSSGDLTLRATGGYNYSDFSHYSIEANVLMNLKADAFVAVFGVAAEEKLSSESNERVNAKLAELTKNLATLGVTKDDVFTDFITQNRVYDNEITKKPNGEVAAVIEKQSGYQTKKTIAIRYKNRNLFEKILSFAAQSGIFDLIKVDYVVGDFDFVRAKLFEEAAKMIKAKEAKYTALLGGNLSPIALSSEKYGAFYPADFYSEYKAYESANEDSSRNASYYNYYGSAYEKRKSSTFFYNPLDPNDFDKSINLIGLEPVVQFTLYLRMDYSTGKNEKQ